MARSGCMEAGTKRTPEGAELLQGLLLNMICLFSLGPFLSPEPQP
jgi:hypothetical protein